MRLVRQVQGMYDCIMKCIFIWTQVVNKLLLLLWQARSSVRVGSDISHAWDMPDFFWHSGARSHLQVYTMHSTA